MLTLIIINSFNHGLFLYSFNFNFLIFILIYNIKSYYIKFISLVNILFTYISIRLIKILLILFILIYSILFIYLLYHLLTQYNNIIHNNLSNSLFDTIKDGAMIMKNNHNIINPNLIQNKTNIYNIYHKLGINNYKDFIYLNTFETQTLNFITESNPALDTKLKSIAILDLIGSQLEVITDFNKIFLSKLLKFSSPLLCAGLSILVIMAYESAPKVATAILV